MIGGLINHYLRRTRKEPGVTLRVLTRQNTVLRIYEPKRDEARRWRKMLNDEMGRACSMNGAKRDAYKV
jgi:hypothetical protein